jgi:hypothetical protein
VHIKSEAICFVNHNECRDEVIIHWYRDIPYALFFTGGGLENYEVATCLIQAACDGKIETNHKAIAFDDDDFRLLVKDTDTLIIVPLDDVLSILEEAATDLGDEERPTPERQYYG